MVPPLAKPPSVWLQGWMIFTKSPAGYPHTILFRFFDLEKACPKTPRHALWRILELKGCPDAFLKILKAIHDGGHSKVRFQGLVSSPFSPERRIREGCPSPPILFNIFHDCLMTVFRARRSRDAASSDTDPGLTWVYQVDGRVAKRRGDRNEEGRHIKRTCVGDFAYADDTALVGHAEEAVHAETIFVRTVSDFAGQVNTGKTEGLRVQSTPGPLMRFPIKVNNLRSNM